MQKLITKINAHTASKRIHLYTGSYKKDFGAKKLQVGSLKDQSQVSLDECSNWFSITIHALAGRATSKRADSK